jgi:hypothetical protein
VAVAVAGLAWLLVVAGLASGLPGLVVLAPLPGVWAETAAV